MTESMYENRELNGVSGAPGIALGRTYHVDRPRIRIPRHQLSADTVAHELERLNQALELSRIQLEEAKNKLDLAEHMQIIDAHLSLFHDPELINRYKQRIRDLHINAEWAVSQVIAEVGRVFDEAKDPYLRERRSDFEYVERRLLINLLGVRQQNLEDIDEPVVLVAHDLSPADLAHINKDMILGIVTDIGGPTSHTAILARAMEIPTVVGLESITSETKSGDLIIVDGMSGKVWLQPSLDKISEYDTRRKLHESFLEDLRSFRDEPAVTADGREVTLAANIELPSELDLVKTNGLKRIGLFRTEFLFLFSGHSPSEDEQYEVYKNVIEQMEPEGETTIRTIDLGGDKAVFAAPYHEDEANPAMGLRAIRLCLAHPDIFKKQLRAILRASHYGKTRIMFPMISGMEELRSAKRILGEVQDELRREEIPFDPGVKVGIMIETPAAAMIADWLAHEVDFFSIGTNDLIQYSLAVDRGNEHVNYLFHPLHPAILRTIHVIVQAGHNAGIPVAMCGEMAGQPEFTMTLLGFGVDEFSMTPNKALQIKRLLSRFTVSEAKQLALNTLNMRTAQEVTDYIVTTMHENYPEEFDWEPLYNGSF